MAANERGRVRPGTALMARDWPARVLVVDDELDHARTMRAILERADHEVALAGDGESALVLARRAKFDLAVVDLRLPGSDGLTVMAQLAELQPLLRFVIVTAYPSASTRAEALARGAQAYLEKPFDPGELNDLLARLL